MMKIFLINIFFLFSLQAFTQDTFSIIALDPATGEIGAAGATCVDGIASFGGIQILNKILPGKGGVNAQAWICLNPHINLDNAIGQMQNEMSPQEIIDWLLENDACNAQNFNPEYRQYGIVDFDANGAPRVAAFTGASADDYKGHRTGETYSIQGNILLGPEVLDGLENGFNNTDGTLAEKLMAAMQGANFAGADMRCLDRGTSSTSAFLRVYKSEDTQLDPYMNLSILEMPFGEEPIDSLQVLFNNFLLTTTAEITKNDVKVYPNPSNSNVQFELENTQNESILLVFYDGKGTQLYNTQFNGNKHSVDTALFKNNSFVIYRLSNAKGELIKADKLKIF